MVVEETILQHWILTKFAFPFFVIFFIIYALLEKTKILGDDKHQLNAMLSAVIGLIFVGVAFPKQIVGNLILFLTVAVVVIFVALILWGFTSGGELGTDFLENKGLKWTFGIVIFIAMIIAVLWSMGIQGGAIDLLFRQSWSETFWTNVAFIVVIAIALAVALKGGDSGGKKKD
jgi:hypothetical protein